MLSLSDIVIQIILLCEALLGILTNSLTVAINIQDWIKDRSLNACDKILLTIGLFNIAFQCTMVSNDMCMLFWMQFFLLDHVYLTFIVLMMFMIYNSFWLAASLCIFYCVKIITFHNPVLAWLKLRISKIVPWLLVGSVIGTFLLSVPAVWDTYKDYTLNISANAIDNSTSKSYKLRQSFSYNLSSLFLGCCVPFFLVLLSIIFILMSLCRHARRMENNAGGFNKPRLEAHIGAAKTVIYLLLHYSIFCLAEIMLLFDIFQRASLWSVFCLVLVYAFAPIQSVILILGNSSLKQAVRRILCPVKQ
ncbi:taste receptor type 2 member 40-like [Rhinatrema bivittatum]|uniref:taste receptor type 2 member 40-like n=1 Tax=Rhinatrema bivittatum TaxID=194408 RepID=UPI0011295528|nr:taste receptor type 2 member 40-like [Rhinatrema bivittatum]